MRPLEGLRVLVTRSEEQAGPLMETLRQLGADPFLMPSIVIEPPADDRPLRESVRQLRAYDWVVLTSVNGVRAVLDAMQAEGVPLEDLSSRKIAVIGPATAKALEAAVREPDVVPKDFVAEAIADALPDVSGQRFLLPRADLARPALADILRDRGAHVTSVVAYRIVAPARNLPPEGWEPDVITLTSGSAAASTVQFLRSAGREQWLERARLVCIGPVTEQALARLGCTAFAVADEYTVPGLVAKLVELQEAGRARV